MSRVGGTHEIQTRSLTAIDQRISVRFSYPVRFTQGLLRPDNPLLRDLLGVGGQARVLAVLDEGVVAARPTLGDELRAYCDAPPRMLDLVAPPLVLPGGEAIKNRTGPVTDVRAAINVHGIDRHSYVLAIGGGALIDAAGYAASTAHRGVRFVRIPTTVLAQDDAALGVKNAINAFGKKNFVGSFAPPFAVICDFELLLTLSDRDWRCGVSEAIKVALLRDPAFFAWIEDHARDLADRSLDAMAWLVHRSAELHLHHIAAGGDPFELGSSRPLDFGHWAAHKLEQLSGYGLRHGEAVAIGIALDSTYSYLAGHLAQSDWRRILELFGALSLPTWTPQLESAEDGARPAVLAGMDEFREHLGGRLTVMLLGGIGSPFEVHSLDDAVVLEAARLLRGRAQEGGEITGCQPPTALAR